MHIVGRKREERGPSSSSVDGNEVRLQWGEEAIARGEALLLYHTKRTRLLMP